MYFTTATLHWNTKLLLCFRSARGFLTKPPAKLSFLLVRGLVLSALTSHSRLPQVLTDAEVVQFCWRKLLLSILSCVDWAPINYTSREDLKISPREAGEGERGGKNGWKGCGRIINGRGWVMRGGPPVGSRWPQNRAALVKMPPGPSRGSSDWHAD